MSESITVTINGRQIETQAGRLLIDVADDNDIVIPRFCYHKKLSVAANCRMCLVEIERAPKPMPACATQVMEGMIVETKSHKAISAQRSTMEFLLINHPLDCPICDQGGECELQDVAMGFGEGISKYSEQKRVVMDKNIGPLIATDFTRCIHCTRCIRFGDEIAGLPELGATGRGENMEIGTYIEKSISSELSGNIIDICPVGALTAKPSRYTARPWELTQHASVAAHDCIGSNIYIHTRGQDVIRVVPRENESINESWISDRDRFSYVAVKDKRRITQPMMRIKGQLTPVNWETALNAVTKSITAAGKNIAALISPQATLEEHFLMQKLVRGLGSNHIDHRINQVDFSAQQQSAIMPWLGRSIESIESLDAALVIGANLRFEQPMLSHRLRKAVIKNKAVVSSISHLDDQYNFDLLCEMNGSAQQLVTDLACVVVALATATGQQLSARLAKMLKSVEPTKEHKAIAKSLNSGANSAIIVGVQTIANPQLSLIQELCETATSMSKSTLGYLSLSANSAGACLAGSTPHRGVAGVEAKKIGQNAAQILNSKHKLLFSFAINPMLDINSNVNLSDKNEVVIAINCFDNEFIQEQADIVLPLANLIESSGTFVNVEGLWQSFKGCVKAKGDSRQGWKILTAIGQMISADDFTYNDSLEVKNEIKDACKDVSLNNLCGVLSDESTLPETPKALQKIGLTAIYSSDDMTRCAKALQLTPLMKMQSVLLINAKQAKSAKLLDGAQVQIKQGKGTATLPLRIDENVPDGCVYVPCGIEAVKHLADAYGNVELEKLS